MGSPAYIQNTKIHRVTLKVPLEHHLLPLPQAVVPHPLLVPPDREVTVRSSQHLLLLLAAPRPATSVELPHTAPGCPHPGCVTTCPQACPVAPPPGGDEYPQNLPRHPPEEHAMARHLGHQNDVSSLLSHHQLVSPRRPHADVSLLPVALPAVVSPGSWRADALSSSTSRPRGPTSAHTNNQMIVSTSIQNTHVMLSQKSTYQTHKHTSVIKHLPWR
jgi:hypothetical protein